MLNGAERFAFDGLFSISNQNSAFRIFSMNP